MEGPKLPVGTGREPVAVPEGCAAFGHLAGPFLDGELARDERDGFAAHVDACDPCLLVLAELKVIDAAASPPVPAVSAERWNEAWGTVRAALQADREAEERSPVGRVLRVADQFTRGRVPRGTRTLLHVAAAAALFALLLVVARTPTSPRGGSAAPAVAAGTPAATRPEGSSPADSRPASVLKVACATPEYMPVVYTTDGDDAMTVVQCVHVGQGT